MNVDDSSRLDHIDHTDPVPPLDPSSSGSAHSSPDPIALTPESESIPPFYQTFDPASSWLPENTRLEDYSVEACAQMERKFWKGLGVGEPGWYGADLLGESFLSTFILMITRDKSDE